MNKSSNIFLDFLCSSMKTFHWTQLFHYRLQRHLEGRLFAKDHSVRVMEVHQNQEHYFVEILVPRNFVKLLIIVVLMWNRDIFEYIYFVNTSFFGVTFYRVISLFAVTFYRVISLLGVILIRLIITDCIDWELKTPILECSDQAKVIFIIIYFW